MPQSENSRPHLPPGPRGLPFFGSLLERERDPMGTLVRGYQRYGDIVRFRNGPRGNVYLLSRPDHVKQVLVDNAANYPRNEGPGALLGNGLFGSEGDFWKRQRGMVQPAFHRERLAGMVGTVVERTQRLLDAWEPRAASGEVFEVASEMSELALSLMGWLVCSQELEKPVHDGIQLHVHFLNHPRHFMADWLLRRMPRFITRRYSRAPAYLALMDTVHGWGDRLIRERRQRDAQALPDDILTLLMQARDSAGQGMSDTELRDELLTLVVGGHEATAMALTWTWYLLHQHPEVQERLRAEVAAVLGDRLPTARDVPALAYANQVFQESMRLYPPAWMFARVAMGPDRIGGYDVPPGTGMAMMSYLVHRHPAAWEEPERFDPDRFSPERSAKRPKFAYLPFGGGQRLCIGNNLALMQATLIIAMVVQRYRVVVRQEGPVEQYAALTLQPRGGLRVSLEPAPKVTADAPRARSA
jgi:cytochrome P450